MAGGVLIGASRRLGPGGVGASPARAVATRPIAASPGSPPRVWSGDGGPALPIQHPFPPVPREPGCMLICTQLRHRNHKGASQYSLRFNTVETKVYLAKCTHVRCHRRWGWTAQTTRTTPRRRRRRCQTCRGGRQPCQCSAGLCGEHSSVGTSGNMPTTKVGCDLVGWRRGGGGGLHKNRCQKKQKGSRRGPLNVRCVWACLPYESGRE
jgi:hypothetical protein